MNDDSYRDLVIQHDKHIDTLTNSVSVLAVNVGHTNKKLDDMIQVINQQNVLQERFSNLDNNFRESFERIHGDIEEIKTEQAFHFSPIAMRWIISLIVGYSITFGTYVVNDLHSLRLLAVEKIQMQRQVNINVDEKLKNLSKQHK